MPFVRLSQRLSRKTRRAIKISRRRWSQLSQETSATQVVFVFGAQRSGSRLPLQVMERSPNVLTYAECHPSAFDGVLLKDQATLTELVNRSPFPLVTLKPICESHRAAELLEAFPGSRALWIFRHFHDVTRSAAVKWGHGRHNLDRLVSGACTANDWRAGGFTPEKLELVRRFYDKQMSTHAAHALMWYLRNTLFFDLQLDRHDHVIPVKYEDLVAAPHEHFTQVFEFLQCPFQADFVSNVQNTSIRPRRKIALPTAIETLCVEMYERLDQCYRRRQPLAQS